MKERLFSYKFAFHYDFTVASWLKIPSVQKKEKKKKKQYVYFKDTVSVVFP